MVNEKMLYRIQYGGKQFYACDGSLTVSAVVSGHC